MNKMLYPVGVAALLLAATPTMAEGVLELCAADIETYCSEVEPGDGRIAACLYAHTATITDECHAATDEFARIMERFFDRLANVHEACSAELHEHCTDVEVGRGKLQCLRALGPELSAGCNGMLETMAQR